MPHDADGKRLSEGDRVAIEAIIEEALPGPDSDLVEVRLIVPPGRHAPQFLLESSAVKKIEATP